MSYWDKILESFSYKTKTGAPDFSNPNDRLLLRMELLKKGWNENAVNELLSRLTEVRSKEQEEYLKSFGEFPWGKPDKSGKRSDIQLSTALNYASSKDFQSQQYKKDANEKAKKFLQIKADDGGEIAKSILTGDKDDKNKVSKVTNTNITKTKTKPKVSRSKTIDRGGDSAIKNLALEHGFKEIKDKDGNTIFKPAPGNAGSLLNEVVSGEVAQMIEEDPNLTEEQILDLLYERFGHSPLFTATSASRVGNSSGETAGGIRKAEIPKGRNPGLHSKLMLAVRSGKRKHKKAVESAQSQGFKNSKIENYYGHGDSFDAMVNDIQGKQVIGPDGTPISQEEAEQLIRSGGGGDNPSDTATLVFDKDSDRVILLFHSDKDSTEALVAQSSIKAEAEANEPNIDKLVKEGKITKEQGEQLKKDQEELVRRNNEVEAKLKKVVNAPGKWFLKNTTTSEVLDHIKNDTGPNGEEDKNKTSTKLGNQPPKRKSGAVLKKDGTPVKVLHKYLLKKGIDPNQATEEQALEAFFEFMGDDNKGVKANGEPIEPTGDQVTLMERINTRYNEQGSPEIFGQIEDIRNETLQLQRDFITKQDEQQIEIDGQSVGLGTFLEANTVWKQFHLEAANPNSEVGVHKYPGMFETNHAGLSVDGEVIKQCMGGKVENKDDFITRFEVGPIEDQKGVSGTQKGKTTGGKRIVYAITAGGKKIEIGQKVMRTKTGKTGRLQTVYNWSKDMKECFDENGKR